jgi:hypothetical protein
MYGFRDESIYITSLVSVKMNGCTEKLLVVANDHRNVPAAGELFLERPEYILFHFCLSQRSDSKHRKLFVWVKVTLCSTKIIGEISPFNICPNKIKSGGFESSAQCDRENS